MSLQNRVLATGEIIAHASRGMFMGNRGILHNERGKLTAKRWTHQPATVDHLSSRIQRS